MFFKPTRISAINVVHTHIDKPILFHQKINPEQIVSDYPRLNIYMGIYLDTTTCRFVRSRMNERKKIFWLD